MTQHVLLVLDSSVGPLKTTACFPSQVGASDNHKRYKECQQSSKKKMLQRNFDLGTMTMAKKGVVED